MIRLAYKKKFIVNIYVDCEFSSLTLETEDILYTYNPLLLKT